MRGKFNNSSARWVLVLVVSFSRFFREKVTLVDSVVLRRTCSNAAARDLLPFCLVRYQVNGRIISKQIHVRVEHVSPSKCRDELKRRVKENEAAKKAAREGGGQSRCWFVFVAGFFPPSPVVDGP